MGVLLGDGVGRGVLVGDGVAVIGRSPRCWEVAPACSDCADTAESDPVADAEKIHTKPPQRQGSAKREYCHAYGFRESTHPANL